MRLLIISLALITSMVANAAPVTWTLDDVSFNDGGTASGSFTYDASTNTYSSVNVTTTAGTIFDGATYSFVNSFLLTAPTNSKVPLSTTGNTDLTGENIFFMPLLASMTDAGGTIAFNLSPPYGAAEGAGCLDAECANYSSMRSVTAGSISSVPIPAAVWLFGSALAGLGWIRRKQAA